MSEAVAQRNGDERAQLVYLTRLRRLVELAPLLYSAATVEDRAAVALTSVQQLFAAEEVFLAVDVVGPPMLRVTRGVHVTPLPDDDEVWRAAARLAGPEVTGVALHGGGQRYAVQLRDGRSGAAIGALAMRVAPTQPVFADFTASLFGRIADMIAVALENAALYESAQRAVDARDAVMAVVSHDLRSPLNSFSLGVGLLRARSDADANGQTLDRMERSVAHMNRLIGDLLDVSRIERRELSVEQVPTSLTSLLDEAVALCAPLADAAKTVLRIDAPSGLRVLSDRHRVLQVIGNLISNALKHAPGGGSVTLAATAGERDVTVSVIDRGAGIDPAQLPRVFERYYRQGGRGLGLGLFIAKAIVDAHGGRIWAESAPGQGARFHFTLRRV